MYQQHIWNAYDARDRCNVAHKHKTKFFIKRSIDCVGRIHPKQRIAVGHSPHNGLCCDIATAAAPVFNEELLTKPVAEPLPNKSRDKVGPTPR